MDSDDPTEGWFTTRVKALTAALIAVGALVAAGKPIVEFLEPFACGTLRLCGAAVEPPASSDTAVLKGVSGWIYAGTQVNGAWKTTAKEGIEPAVTIDSGEIPVTGEVYKLISPVHLRVSAPIQSKDGTRPEMPDSKGELGGGRSVKVDKLQSIDLKDPPRTWIWAHVTVVD
jgi:hypothetical protein